MFSGSSQITENPENLENLNKIIDYNIKNNIHFYRLTSKLIPLATLNDINFNYYDKFKNYYLRALRRKNTKIAKIKAPGMQTATVTNMR